MRALNISLAALVAGLASVQMANAQVTIIEQTRPAVLPVTTTTSTLTVSEAMRGPQYGVRLKNMMDQMKMASARGWLDSAEFERLRTEHDRIATALASAAPDGYNRTEVDSFEKQLTLLNQMLHHDMTH
jgi:hypothetical protein